MTLFATFKFINLLILNINTNWLGRFKMIGIPNTKMNVKYFWIIFFQSNILPKLIIYSQISRPGKSWIVISSLKFCLKLETSRADVKLSYFNKYYVQLSKKTKSITKLHHLSVKHTLIRIEVCLTLKVYNKATTCER